MLKEYNNNKIRVLLNKVTWRIIPFIFILYIINYFARINIGFAALQMNSELNFDMAVFGLGAGIFFIGYVILQVPSNIILHKIGVSKWIAPMMILQGIFSFCMIFIKTPILLYFLRFMLGLSESGFFCGMVLYLSYWFPQNVRAKYNAMFFMAIPLTSVIGGPVSGYILKFHGTLGMSGWQWLFIVEAFLSILAGIMVFLYLSDRPKTSKWLTKQDKSLLYSLTGKNEESNYSLKKFLKINFKICKKKILLYLLIMDITMATAIYMVSIWTPQIIKRAAVNISIDISKVSYLSAIPFLGATFGMLIISYSSDKRKDRFSYLIYCSLIGCLALIMTAINDNLILTIIFLSLVATAALGSLSPFWTLPTKYFKGSSKAVVIAIISCIGNLGGFFGGYILGITYKITGNFELGLFIISVLLIINVIITMKLRDLKEN